VLLCFLWLTRVSEYIVENYQNFKTLNPKFGFLVRDRVGHPRATLIASFAGPESEEVIDVTNYTQEQIDEALRKAVVRGGEIMQTLPQKLAMAHPDVPIDILDLPEVRQQERLQWEKDHEATFK
jgi:hypothetical protein